MGKFRREPYRCRGCNHRFYVYIPRAEDEVEDLEAAADAAAAEASEENASSEDEKSHNPSVAKPAEP